MDPQYPCKICKNEVKDKDPSICCEICKLWSYIEFANISLKPYEKLQNDGLSAWYCPICVRISSFSDLRTKVRRMFLSSDNLNHEQKPQTAPEKLNKETRELMKKFYQIILLNDANQNTVSCDYYDLNDFNKVIVTK